ncbi:MAG: flippase-like domain-containing protein [Polyangiaceae bacterium]|nr:flippase-like domain-containing protein [Polyangiaceae bacterium]
MSAPSLGERLRPHAAKIVASIVLASGFLWVLRRGGFPVIPSGQILARIPPWGWAVAIVYQAASIHFRTYRWIYLLRPIRRDLDPLRVYGIGLVGFTAVVFAPLRLGELARPSLLAQDGEVTFTQAMGTVGAERVLDGLFVTVLLFLALSTSTPLSPLPDHLGDLPLPVAAVPTAAYGALLLFSGAFAAMGVFFFARDWARRAVHGVVGKVSLRLAEFLSDKVERLADGLQFFRSREASLPFLRDTAIYWAVQVLGAWLAMRSVGLSADPGQTMVVAGVTGIGSLIPAGPGFFGAYQLAAYAGLAMFFPVESVQSGGAAWVFVTYSTNLAMNALQLPVGYWMMRRGARACGSQS